MTKKLINNSGQEFTVLEEYKKPYGKRIFTMWLIQFTESGYTREVYKSNAEKGKAKDPYAVSVMGVGYEGEFEKTFYHTQARRLWSNMIKRCYDPNYSAGYYGKGYTVDGRWLCFANFVKDLPELDNFNLWLAGGYDGNPKYNLDKDLKVAGNKVYSKKCCSFVPEGENKAAGARNGKPYTRNQRLIKK